MIEFVIGLVKFSLRVLEAWWFYVRSISKKLFEDDILFLASGLAFNGILAMIPLLLLSAAALGTILNSSELSMRQLNDVLNAIFPQQPFAVSIKDSILTAVADIVAYRTSIGLFGVAVLVWTATSLFDALRSALHQIYRIEKTKSLLSSLAHHVGFVILLWILFLLSSVTIWMLSFLEGLGKNVPALEFIDFPGFDEFLPTAVVTVLTAFMFYLIYRYIPDTKPPRVAGVISTVTTTALWVVSGKLFAIYLSQFSAIGTIYGPYAFVLVLLIWVYYSSLLFVVGGIVGQVYWERLRLKQEGKLIKWV